LKIDLYIVVDFRVQRLLDVLFLFDGNARMLSRRIVYQKEP